jgi:hypothetical protein
MAGSSLIEPQYPDRRFHPQHRNNAHSIKVSGSFQSAT